MNTIGEQIELSPRPKASDILGAGLSPYTLVGLEFAPEAKFMSDYDKVNLIKSLLPKYHHGTTFEMIDCQSRKRSFVDVRKHFMFLAGIFTSYSLREIGEQFPKRGPMDHSSVIHAKSAWQDLIDTDKSTARMNEEFIKELKELTNTYLA